MALVNEWESHRAAMISFRRLIMEYPRRLTLRNYETGTISYIQQMKDRLDRNWANYNKQYNHLTDNLELHEGDILLIDDDIGDEPAVVARCYDQSREALEARIRQLSAMAGPAPKFTPKPAEITLPIFSGKFYQYTAFRSAVLARVIEADYPAHSKIDLIVSALKGDAKNHIGEVRGQDEPELNRIWEALELSYHNPYLLMRSHVGLILDIPIMEKSSAQAYRLLIGTVNQNLHALAQLEIPTDQLDPVILEILLRKIDPEGITAWETTRPQDRLPSLKDLIGFLETRIVILSNTAHQLARTRSKEESQPTRDHARLRDDQNRRPHKREATSAHSAPPAKAPRYSTSASTSSGGDSRPSPPSSCPMDCDYKKPHFLWMCRAFRALDYQKRLEFIKQKKLCRRCITSCHPIEACKGQKCADCNDDIHNQMLCPKYMILAKAHVTRPSSARRRRGGNTNSKQSE